MKPFFALAAAAALLPGTLAAQSEFSRGEPVVTEDQAAETSTAEPGIGETYQRETHGDWAIRCTIVGEDEEFCHMFQLLFDEADNSVASFRVAPLANPEGDVVAVGELTAPLETALQPGVTLTVDSNTPLRYPFAFCSEIGCHSRMGLSTDDLDAFRRGAEATIQLVAFPDPENPVEVSASLSGFTAGYRALSEGAE